MYTLKGFWHAAARLTGQIDLSMLDRADAAEWSAARLAAAGVEAPLALLGQPELRSQALPLTLADHRYPDRLAQMPYAPPVLFVQGNLDLLHRPCVAIVGSRRCTSPGAALARELAGALAGVGAVTVSGLAHGIDEAAHLSASGLTVAVLGHALDADLGLGRRRRMAAILDAGGLLVSEFIPGTQPAKRTFPLRNRVIAWLSRATVVVEAGLRSGALITARAAVTGGRELFAVPGHPSQEQSEGCLCLIDEGAPMVRSGGELLRRLDLVPPRDPDDANEDAFDAEVSEDCRLLRAMGGGASLDQLAERTGCGVSDLVRQLASLELSGRAQRLPGDRYAALPVGYAKR